MIKSAILVLCFLPWILLPACSVSGRDDVFRAAPSDIKIKKSTMVGFKKIKASDNTVIGYLEETENIISGANSPDGQATVRIFYVYDKEFNKVGFMTEQGRGAVYQYTREGAARRLSEGTAYTIEGSSKRLLSYEGMIYYEDFDPYPLWHEKR